MDVFPAMPLEEWVRSKETLHRFLQLVGKIRMTAGARRNHWWHVPFHLTGRGLTTRPMGQVDGNPVFTLDFDLVVHQLRIAVLDGRETSISLVGQSVGSLHEHAHAALAALGIRIPVDIDAPFDLPDSARPFAQDTSHTTYDPMWINRYWQVLSRVNLLLEEFSARFVGKISPVHHFWHTMDIAVTRFGRAVIDQPAEAGSVVREAYSRDVVSSGFWFGDENLPQPAFYSYTAPEPTKLAEQPLQPRTATWRAQGAGHLAILCYDDVREDSDPRARVLEFYESAYQAGARLSGWDVDALTCPGGITDAHLTRHDCEP